MKKILDDLKTFFAEYILLLIALMLFVGCVFIYNITTQTIEEKTHDSIVNYLKDPKPEKSAIMFNALDQCYDNDRTFGESCKYITAKDPVFKNDLFVFLSKNGFDDELVRSRFFEWPYEDESRNKTFLASYAGKSPAISLLAAEKFAKYGNPSAAYEYSVKAFSDSKEDFYTERAGSYIRAILRHFACYDDFHVWGEVTGRVSSEITFSSEDYPVTQDDKTNALSSQLIEQRAKLASGVIPVLSESCALFHYISVKKPAVIVPK